MCAEILTVYNVEVEACFSIEAIAFEKRPRFWICCATLAHRMRRQQGRALVVSVGVYPRPNADVQVADRRTITGASDVSWGPTRFKG